MTPPSLIIFLQHHLLFLQYFTALRWFFYCMHFKRFSKFSHSLSDYINLSDRAWNIYKWFRGLSLKWSLSFNVFCNQIHTELCILWTESQSAVSDSSYMYLRSQQVQAKAFIIISLPRQRHRSKLNHGSMTNGSYMKSSLSGSTQFPAFVVEWKLGL